VIISTSYKDNLIKNVIISSMRTKKDRAIRRGMCDRFVESMNQLQMTPAELARRLGYLNSTTISKLQRGEAFVDVERLYLLSQLETPEGKRIDLNWLITGQKYSKEKGDA
jgi:transcriptional regulator with XRE-family HTH domain